MEEEQHLPGQGQSVPEIDFVVVVAVVAVVAAAVAV